MNLLTPTGYKNIEDVNIGDELIAYDINTGVVIINTLLKKELWTHNMLPENPQTYQSVYNEETQEYEEVLIYSGMSSEQVFQETYGDWKFYEINGTWKLYKNQSIWSNMKVVHVSDLKVGDVIYDDDDNDVVITSIIECTETSWWRLEVSGDHSYISDNLQLHNASRYWQKQNASFNWNSTGPTNWGSASGVSDGASIPTSVDDVFFDGVGVNGNIDSTISANITILSLTFTSGYTATVTINSAVTLTVAGNFTDNTAHTWVVGNVSTSILQISATSTITSGGKTFPGGVNLYIGSSTRTIVGDWTIAGLLGFQGVGVTVNKTTSEVIYCNGFAINNASILGTITLRITGGTISTLFASGTISVNEVILDGNITFVSQYVYIWNVVNFSYISGTITNANLVTLTLNATTTYNWNVNPIIFGAINFGNPSGQNINLISKLNSITIGGSSNVILTFSGNFGFECSNFNFTIVNGNNITLKDGITYLVNSSFQLYAYGNYTTTTSALISSSLTNRAFLILKNGATCVSNSRFTRIDASGGRTINTWNGTVTDCLNVRSFTDLQTVAISSIS